MVVTYLLIMLVVVNCLLIILFFLKMSMNSLSWMLPYVVLMCLVNILIPTFPWVLNNSIFSSSYSTNDVSVYPFTFSVVSCASSSIICSTSIIVSCTLNC
jgi:hypothetical protein